jgi:uncharacterized delta-60 repeat protein
MMGRNKISGLVAFAALTSVALARCVGDDSTLKDAGPDVTTDVTTNDGGTETGPSDASDAGDGFDGFICNVGGEGGAQVDQLYANGSKTNLGNFGPNGAVVDSKGRLYVVGLQSNTCNGTGLAGQVYRFGNDGNLDTTFGAGDAGASSNGVCIHYDVGDAEWSITIDEPGDRVYVGGFAFNGATASSHFHATITALHQDGSFDTTFNATGKVDLNPVVDAGNSSFGVVDGIALWQNKIILTGSTDQIQATPGHGRNTGFVTRLNHDGSTDNFGLVADNDVFGYYGTSVDTAGIITVVGTVKANGDAGNTANAFAVRQWGANGQRTNFGNGGSAVFQFKAPSEARDIVSMNGHYLVGGGASFVLDQPGSGGHAAIVAFNPGGAIDTAWSGSDAGIEGGAGSFVANGDVVYDQTWQIRELAPECDGKLLFGARLDLPPDAGVDGGNYQQLVLRRLNANGTFDGTLAIRFPANIDQVPVGIAQDPVTGKIVMVGRDLNGKLVLVRFNP